MADEEDLVAIELEALEVTYGDSLDVVARQPLHIRLHATPFTGGDEAKQYVCTDLELALTPAYPDAVPDVQLRQCKGAQLMLQYAVNMMIAQGRLHSCMRCCWSSRRRIRPSPCLHTFNCSAVKQRLFTQASATRGRPSSMLGCRKRQRAWWGPWCSATSVKQPGMRSQPSTPLKGTASSAAALCWMMRTPSPACQAPETSS